MALPIMSRELHDQVYLTLINDGDFYKSYQQLFSNMYTLEGSTFDWENADLRLLFLKYKYKLFTDIKTSELCGENWEIVMIHILDYYNDLDRIPKTWKHYLSDERDTVATDEVAQETNNQPTEEHNPMQTFTLKVTKENDVVKRIELNNEDVGGWLPAKCLTVLAKMEETRDAIAGITTESKAVKKELKRINRTIKDFAAIIDKKYS